MKGRKSKREIQHEAISHSYAKSSHAMWNIHMLCEIFACYEKSSHAMQNSKGHQIQDKFRALPRVHCIHTICHIEAWEVRSPTLQTMCKSELKWRSYGHLKTTTTRWKWISQPLFNLVKVLQAHLPLAKLKNFVTPFQPCKIFLKSSDIFALISLDFVSQDILYNYLVSPCNQLKIFVDIRIFNWGIKNISLYMS